MSGAGSQRSSIVPRRARARVLAVDRVSVTLCLVFLPAALFYLWTAGSSFLLALHGGQAEPYNALASAFLHLRLSVGRAPARLLALADPYDPSQNAAVTNHFNIHDYVLYGRNLYLTWGPVPALVLAPLHLLGLAPTSSAVVALFAIVGLGFALATLGVLLRKLGNPPLWMCALAALTLALASAVPFMLRRPAVYEEAISGGYCFAMIGVWLAVTALSERRSSSLRLVLMSLCFGLAAGCRPTLGLLALMLVPVYLALRRSRSRRGLLVLLVAPVGVCILLLAAYNQARFGQPLEVGTRYQLAAYDSRTAHFASPGYVPPGLWSYAMDPPRPIALFPFVKLGPPPVLYPGRLPAHYTTNEITGGLLPMAPIVVFLGALPWIWRRRPELLGSLAAPLLTLAAIGAAIALFLSYEFFATTERYEVDFSTLLLLGALAAWLTLSVAARGPWRRLVRVGGALLAAWGCVVGVAVSFTGYSDLLALEHPHTWATLERLTTPLSTAIAGLAGRPILVEVQAPGLARPPTLGYADLGFGVTTGWLSQGEEAHLTIVSPDTREAALVATLIPAYVTPGTSSIQFGAGAPGLLARGPGRASSTYGVPLSGEQVRIPVHLRPGLNRLGLIPLVDPGGGGAVPPSEQLMVIENLSLAGEDG
jgi:hypothetical protein